MSIRRCKKIKPLTFLRSNIFASWSVFHFVSREITLFYGIILDLPPLVPYLILNMGAGFYFFRLRRKYPGNGACWAVLTSSGVRLQAGIGKTVGIRFSFITHWASLARPSDITQRLPKNILSSPQSSRISWPRWRRRLATIFKTDLFPEPTKTLKERDVIPAKTSQKLLVCAKRSVDVKV